MQTYSKGHTYTNPRSGQYLKHAHSHITRPVAATDSCVALNGAYQRGIAVHYTTQVGAVGWEPHSSSTTTCAGKVDHELPENLNKGHTYTNPRLGHYLTYAHSHITQAVAAMNSCFALTGTHRHGIAVGQWPGKTRVQKTLSCRGESFKCQLQTTHGGALAGNRTAVLPRHARRRRIMGLVYVCPLL